MHNMKRQILLVAFAGTAAFAFADTDLEKEFVEAIKSGRPLAAEAAFKRLSEERRDIAPIRYFQAAEIARQMGRETLRRDRLAHYLRTEKTWNASVEEAAWYLCLNGGAAEHFGRLAKSVPASDQLYSAGRTLMDRAREAKRGAEILKVAEVMLEKFPENDRRRALLSFVMGQLFNNIQGIGPAQVREMLLKYPLKDIGGGENWSIQWMILNRRGDFPADFILEWCIKCGVALPPAVFGMIGQFNADLRNERDAEYCRRLAKLFKEVEPIVLKPGCGDQANSLLCNKIRLSGLYFKPSQTNEQAAAYYNLLMKTVGCYEADKVNKREMMARTREMWQKGLLSNGKVNYWQKLCVERPEILDDDVLFGSSGIMRAEAAKAKSVAGIKAFIAKNPDRAWEARRRTRDLWIECGETKQVLEDVESELVWNAASGMDGNAIMNTLSTVSACKIKDAEKIAFLKRVYTRIGAHAFFNTIKTNKSVRDRFAMFKTPEAEAFVKEIDEKKPAGDRFVRHMKELFPMQRQAGNLCPDRAHAIMAETFADYGTAFPQDGRKENGIVNRMVEKYFGLCRDNLRSCEKFAEVLLKGFGKQKKANWDYLRDIQGNLREKPELHFAVRDRRAEVLDSANIWDGYQFPADTGSLPKSANLEEMRVDVLYSLMRANVGIPQSTPRDKARFTDALKAKVVSTAFRRFDMPKWSVDKSAEMLSWLGGAATNGALMAQFPFDKVAGDVLDREKGWNPDFAPRFIAFAAQSGRRDAYLRKYLASLGRVEPSERVLQLVRIAWNPSVAPYPGKKDDASINWFGDVLEQHLLPTLKAVPDSKAPLAQFTCNTGDWNRYCNYFNVDFRRGDEAVQKLGGDLSCEFSRLMRHGMRCQFVDNGVRPTFNQNAYRRALRSTNEVEMVKVADMIGRDAQYSWPQGLINLINDTRKAGAWQPLYLLVNAIPGNVHADVVTLATRCRAEAATKLPGVYPVGEKDPAYPLYVAADELSRKNAEGALKLFKANMPVFEREILNLPPDFVAWGVDQLRLQRGKNDELLLKARKLATAIISAESKVTPELVAAMLLVRAESFRDQRNFEAAKLEYQSIRDNPVYHKTPSGRKAMFRAIDLQIESGAGSQAEQTLEYWLSQPDPEIQAEAHYFLARIAFDRKDYDECIKQLKEVFAINLTHTDARFLQGRWKLATNSEVDETDVWIGKLADRTAICPGQQLSITVQDRNLSVAGGGSSIPVVVTTDRGKDLERIYLYPSARDPNIFKGLVDVRLGKAAPSNTVLEVCGGDVASYAIDPEFLKARGLPLGEPKKLRVVDDARLAIGAGAPRTEESDAEAQIEAMVGEGQTSGANAIAAILRPGNPLYIAVSDKDRSLGGDSDTVSVSVRTTSGDRLGDVVLTEVRPYAGVFRGVVPTTLPQPRAFASDTAAGFNPGDVINSTRDGLWRSLSDGQAIKWFAVDTMGSHVVSAATVRVVAPEEITALSLDGELGGESIPVATLPAVDPKTKVGLRYQTANAGGFRGEAAIREYMSRADAPKATAVTNIVYVPAWNDRSNVARYSGAFLQPSGYDYLRFRLVPRSEATDALRNLFVAVALDGKTVFTGKGPDLQNAAIVADVAPGAHFLEVFATASSQKNDAFKLLWEPIDEEPRDLPMDWFDAEKHKEVWDMVADKAVIKRTADGFEAVFSKPVRLRTLRWTFTGRRSPDVAVSEVTATDVEGRQIVPVESDFSDAQSNETLEVAPGDQIIVQYSDEVTASGSKRVLERSLGSRFTDGRISLNFEQAAPPVNGVPQLAYHEAYRFIPGDSMVVIVGDSDLDVTDGADSVDVTVKSKLGGEQKLRLVEQKPDVGGWKPEDGIHTGRFFGLLSTVRADAALPTNAAGRVSSKLTIRAAEDDAVTVSYDDRENTLPGVPCERRASVHATKQAVPRLTLFHTRKVRVVDTSDDAKLKLMSIRKRAGNENVEKVFRDAVYAVPMTRKASDDTNAIPVNISAPLLVRVNDVSRARHAASRLTLEAVTERELERAEAEGGKPVAAHAALRLGGDFGGVKLKAGDETAREARRAGSFNGVVYLAIGSIDNADESVLKALNSAGGQSDREPAVLAVNGSDTVRLRVKDGDEVLAERTVSFVSNGSLALLDSTWSAERDAVHAGERFFVQVNDADRDATDDADRITVDVKSLVTGRGRKVVLTETIPHSGVFNGTLRPILFPKSEEIPGSVTGAVASVDELVAEDRFAADFGDRLVFSYRDERVLPGSEPRTLCTTGLVHRGSDGTVRLFSKRFRDSDQAVLVQFRLAECLFEQAKEHRKLKQPEKSADAIAKGRFILEEALKNYPDSSHVVQGEFLLANLFQELATEARDAKDTERARQLFTDALSRFSTIVAVWPEGEYAARAQYHKALCLEMLEDYRRAAEEYVKMTYLYPESELVGDATIRLATHYYTRERRYDVSARIYENFQRRFPQHEKAARALFMCGSCYVKQAEEIQKKAEAEAEEKNVALRGTVKGACEMYEKAAEAFDRLGEAYRETTTPELRAQAMYWSGDVQLRAGNAKGAYRTLKRCVLDYPETEWARRARGLLLQESDAFRDMDN